MSALPFGIDISSYQGANINYDLMKRKTKFVAVRAGISWGFEDPVFAQSWQALKGHNRIAYHVLYPSQDVTRQVDWLFDILSRAGFDPKTDRLAIDIELWQGQTPQRVTEATTQMYDQITQRTGRKPIIYSAAWFVNPRMVVTPKLADADWWIANYPPKGSTPGVEHPGPPLLPRGVTKYLIHQTSETGIGRNFGLPSGAIDTNRWNGTLEDVQAYFGLTEQEPEPPVDPPTDPEPDPPTQPKAYKATVTANVLNVRKAPQDIVVGSLKRGAEVEVLDEQDAWRKLGHQLWVSGEWLKRIANAPDPQPQPDLVPYVLWGQRDARWASDRMGASNITLGQQGCLVTAVASVMASYGIDTDPKRYNGRLSSEGGYLAPNLMYWQMPRIFWGVKLTEYELFAGGTGWQRSVDTILSSRRPVLAMVDMIPGGAFNQHWVTIVGKRGNDYIITDPWTADLVPLTRYENKIYRLAGYSRD